jgi:hypothetical protein
MKTPSWRSATEAQVYAIKMRIMPVINALMYKTPPRPDPNALFVTAMSRDILLEGQMATKKETTCRSRSLEPARGCRPQNEMLRKQGPRKGGIKRVSNKR